MTSTLVFPAVVLVACGLAGCRAQGSGQRDLRNAVTRLEQQMQDVDRYLSKLERGAGVVRDKPEEATRSSDDELRELRDLLMTQEKAWQQRIRALEQNQQEAQQARQSLVAEHERVLRQKDQELAAARAEIGALRTGQRDSKAAEPASDAPQRSREAELPNGDASLRIERPSAQEHASAVETVAADDAETVRRLRAENAALRARLRAARSHPTARPAPPAAAASSAREPAAGGASELRVHGAGSTLIIHADQGTVNVYVDDAGKATVRTPPRAAPSEPRSVAPRSTQGGS